ncbi:TonB family protein [Moraxella lincolnii]|uniref:energy transducer TonB n=1 Tax=Lwoffella lincolnii TaxID=90241 RepID=UPI0030CAE8B5
MTKLVYSDWLISLALHGSLVAGVALLNQPSPPLATRPITEPIRWVDVQTMTSEPSASVHQKSVHQKEIDTTDHLQKPKAQKQPLKAVYQTSDMDTLAKPMAQKTQKPKKNTATNQVKNQTKNQMTNQETSTKQAMITTPNASISSSISSPIKTATVDKQSMDMSKNSVDEINIDTDTANVATNAQEIEQPKKDENKTELQSKTDKTTIDKTKADETKDTQSAKNPKTDHVNQWKTRFIANVNRNKRYPSHARKAGIQGSALLSVHVMANGNIHCCDVKQSTGSSQLDKAALQAAQKSANQSREPPQTNHAFGFDFYVDYILSD